MLTKLREIQKALESDFPLHAEPGEPAWLAHPDADLCGVYSALRSLVETLIEELE